MWKYVVNTGKLYNKEGNYFATGYSGGAGGKTLEAVNNPDFQHVKGVGPLPCGSYEMGTPILQHPHVGRYAIPLIPHPDNKMFDRDQFFCHGDNQHENQSASDGCIIMPYNIRVVLGEGTDKTIEVVDEA